MTATDQQLVDSIAAVLPVPTKPYPLGWEDDTEWEVRRLHASSWINVGITDPHEVRRWVAAGVENARIARDARRLGYRPEDPWVVRSASSFTIPDGTAAAAPSALTSRRNRRRARAAWIAAERERATIAAAVAADVASMAAVVRAESFGSGLALGALEILDGTGSPIEGTDVLLAFDELTTAVDAMRQVGNASPADVADLLAMLDVVQRHVDACAPGEQAAMRAQLLTARAWLAEAH
jgi:hypothetical protein